jgi:DNA invertase Pin-like site-specific DNA recombinase
VFIGYVRVSTFEQHEELQIDALTKAGCEKIFTDKVSGAKFDRPGLNAALDFARPGDVMVVWKLDRLGRSIIHLIDLLTTMKERGINFISLTEQIDTTTPGGKLIFHIMASLAEFERDLIRERTLAGLASARARGRLGGRKRKLTNGKLVMAKKLYADKKNSVRDICATLDISEATLYRYMRGEEK